MGRVDGWTKLDRPTAETGIPDVSQSIIMTFEHITYDSGLALDLLGAFGELDWSDQNRTTQVFLHVYFHLLY